jgi:hypothetical protein
MPTILRVGPYRVYFFSHEPGEPPHVHVDRENRMAKFWLGPIRLARSRGFRGHELTRIAALLRAHETELLAVWREFFGE